MPNDRHNRVVRCIVSALLGSTLSERDLEEAAGELSNGGEMSRQVAGIIRRFLGGPSAPVQPGLDWEAGPTTGDPLLDEALAIVKRRRLSKVQIVKKMRLVSPEGTSRFAASLAFPLESMLREFLGSESPDKRLAFLELLEGGRTREDEYLKGIMREKH